MKKEYEKEINSRAETLKKYNKIGNSVGIFKLAVILAMSCTFYQMWEKQFPMQWFALFCGEAVIFLLASIGHTRVINRIHYEKGLIDIAKRNISRITGEWRKFSDTGEEFIDYEHEYAADLDIVGQHSLFQFLNSTGTFYGRNRFAKDLLSPEYKPEDIRLRQKAIAEISSNYEWAGHMEYRFSQIGIDPSFPQLILQLQDKKRFLKSAAGKYLFMLSRFLTCLSILFFFITGKEYFKLISCIMIAFQLLLWAFGLSRIKNYLGIMRKLPYKLSKYYEALEDFVMYDFEAQRLQEIQSVLSTAREAFHKVSVISDHISQGQNEIVCLLLNALLLWDYKNSVDLDQWKQEYGDFVENWFGFMGEFESFLSFANLSRNCSNICVPEITGPMGRIHGKELGHPLLSNERRVCNNIEINNEILIISGSNMSGKTTFMRTLGINMVLACAGSFVCAEQMEFSVMKVMTSMRIKDDLGEGISTFYAELKKIKRIIDAAKQNENLLFLIDEIFRGTNSSDRLKGAEEVLRTLHQLGMRGMITTHDLEICKLEGTYETIVNYSFHEHYENNEICFDYKMKKGISKTTNAEYLLKKVGII